MVADVVSSAVEIVTVQPSHIERPVSEDSQQRHSLCAGHPVHLYQVYLMKFLFGIQTNHGKHKGQRSRSTSALVILKNQDLLSTIR